MRWKARRRLSTNLRNFMLSAELGYSKQRDSSGVKQPAVTDMTFAGLGRIGDVRVRGSAQWDIYADREVPLRRADRLLVGVRNQRLGRRAGL